MVQPSAKKFFPSEKVYPKLAINQPGDKYEREADAMAERVMKMPEGSPIQRMCPECTEEEKEKKLQNGQQLQRQPASVEAMAQRQEAGEPEEEMMMQRQESEEEELMTKAEGGGMTASPTLQRQLQSSKGSGAPMPASTSRFMSQAFGTDFSGVRVHTGQQANEMNKGIQAKAFTHGSDIYFRQGQYNPGSTEGKKLLAHELTHVVQQNQGLSYEIQRQAAPRLDPRPPSTPSRGVPNLRVIEGGLNQASRRTARRAGWRYFWRAVIRRFAIRGATAATLAAVDGPLPIGDLISLGLALWMIWDLIQLWDVIWQEATEMQNQEQQASDTEAPPVAQSLPRPREESEPQNDCFATHPYAIPCTGLSDPYEVAAMWLINNGHDYEDLGNCYGVGSFPEGAIDACDGAPGERYHCNVRGEDFEISIFGCLCCDENGNTGLEWRGAHQSVNLSTR